MLEVTCLLVLESNERVNMASIYGIGGIGKSSIGRALYNLISDQFEGLCFLTGIEKRQLTMVLHYSKKNLLSEILGEKDIDVANVYIGISIVKKRLNQKKVFLIIDDVDKLEQLQVLAGGHDWFGFGSKIIITIRDKNLLASQGVVKPYEVKQLTDEKALELFSWHAFKTNKIDPSYMAISKFALFYAGGIPLALEVIGSNLFGESIHVSKFALDTYEMILHK